MVGKRGGGRMSGGSLDYFYSYMQDHVGDFADKELDDLVKDLAELFHDREWYLSGDTGIGDWREAREKFKKKWFSKGSRPKRIEKYLDDIKADVMNQFCDDGRKCMNCKHWKLESGSSHYGKCKNETQKLMHRSDVCKKWEAMDE